MTEINRKAIALLSGGLDSSLAVRLVLDQGIEIVAVNFVGPFCTCTPKNAGCVNQASEVARRFGVPVRIIHKGMDYVRIVQKPSHGYGRAINPCIDCRIYMLRKARELMPLVGASFVVTGDVLGQRPMSQHRRSIDVIEKESGLADYILRPLSANLLPPTFPERAGVVNREKLLSLSGRSRKLQMETAARLGVGDYPCPSGGCLLTQRTIAERLRDLFAHRPDYDMTDIHLIKTGRHIRLNEQAKIIVSRNSGEEALIRSRTKPGDVVYEPESFRGPIALLCGRADAVSDAEVGMIISSFSHDEGVSFTLTRSISASKKTSFSVKGKAPRERIHSMSIGIV